MQVSSYFFLVLKYGQKRSPHSMSWGIESGPWGENVPQYLFILLNKIELLTSKDWLVVI